jgi:preprotein translocase subunit SecA
MQLRGRAGRQGDPGSSRFFISLEDDLFVKYRLADLLPHEADETARACEIERIQRIIEGQNLEIKKTLNRYSFLLEQQRQILFNQREDWLRPSCASEFFAAHVPDMFAEYCDDRFEQLFPRILLYCVDTAWIQYLSEIDDVREGIHLHRIGGQDPYLEFQKFAVIRFDELMDKIEERAVHLFSTMAKEGVNFEHMMRTLKTPSATWTYLVNDDPFEHRIVAQLFQNIGIASGAALMWPLMVLLALVKKLRRKRHAT